MNHIIESLFSIRRDHEILLLTARTKKMIMSCTKIYLQESRNINAVYMFTASSSSFFMRASMSAHLAI